MNFARLLHAHIETLRRAAADVEIRGAPLAVFLYLNQELDITEYRPVKVASVATELHLKPWNAAKALRRLTQAGYIEAGGKIDRVRSYRLRIRPPAPAEKAG